MIPIISYLKDGTLPEDHNAPRRLKVQATRFVTIGDVLYKMGFSRLYLRCLALDKTNYVMREVHEGTCRNHSRARSLVHKLIQARYYWPIMQKDAQSYVRARDKCQRFSDIIRTNRGTYTNERPLVVYPVGVRYSGTISSRCTTVQVPFRRD